MINSWRAKESFEQDLLRNSEMLVDAVWLRALRDITGASKFVEGLCY